MHGDFSRWLTEHDDNDVGVLHQQGRVLLDADVNADTRVRVRWQDDAARSMFGPHIAATTAEARTAFEVISARPHERGALVSLRPGRIWADGIRSVLPGDPSAPVERYAEPIDLPIEGLIDGSRSAVILEVWKDSVSGFERTELLEAALGGPDTTERLHTFFRLRLGTLGAGESCTSALDRLQDDRLGRGKLTVTLSAPETIADPDCPVEAGGGYTGFEHNLYRVEVVPTDSPEVHFAWSTLGGGLVCRGHFRTTAAGEHRLSLTANKDAVVALDRAEVYIEAYAVDPHDGYPTAIYGATATINDIGELELPATPALGGGLPATTDDVFVRVWHGLRTVQSFSVLDADGEAPELADGIRLMFEPPSTATYHTRDHWTFSVRAAGLFNPPTLIDREPPHGIQRLRVPLAEVTWRGTTPGTLTAEIEDCRVPVRPLTDRDGCCVVRVGDGVHSRGDVSTITDAIERLPARGGRICVLPGIYPDPVVIENRSNLTIEGCGRHSVLGTPLDHTSGGSTADAKPMLTIRDGHNITVRNLSVVSATHGGVHIAGDKTMVEGIELADLYIVSAALPGIAVWNARHVGIRRCDVVALDLPSTWSAIVCGVSDATIEHNRVRVGRLATTPPDSFGRVSAGFVAPRPPIGGSAPVPRIIDDVLPFDLDAEPPTAHSLGGIWLRGGCANVRVIDNLISGGAGNGITLGHAEPVPPDGADTPSGVFTIRIPWPFGLDDPCGPCLVGRNVPVPVPHPTDPNAAQRWRDGGPLRDIRIERNRIRNMGLAGVAVAAFYEAPEDGITLVLRLHVLGNEIRGCLRRPMADVADALMSRVGYGAVALASVTDLTVHDNVIANNGRDHVAPLCGLYVAHAEAADVRRNRIFDNGRVRGELSASRARYGARGGIYLANAVAPVAGHDASEGFRLATRRAAAVHDNEVSAPTGHALWAAALGPLSVHGNRLTTHAITRGLSDLRHGLLSAPRFGALYKPALDSLNAARETHGIVVYLRNLGRSLDSASSFNLLLAGAAIYNGGRWARDAGTTTPLERADSEGNGEVSGSNSGLSVFKALRAIQRERVMMTQPGRYITELDHLSRTPPLWSFDGSIAVSDNQILLESTEPVLQPGSVVYVESRDDVNVADNQVSCFARTGAIAFNAYVKANTARITSNRFTETGTSALISCLATGAYITMALNQASHCLFGLASRTLTGDGNIEIDDSACDALKIRGA